MDMVDLNQPQAPVSRAAIVGRLRYGLASTGSILTGNRLNHGAAMSDVRPQDLADQAVDLVRRWLTESREGACRPLGAALAGVLKDPNGLDFTVGFVDRWIRPELSVAAADLRGLTASQHSCRGTCALPVTLSGMLGVLPNVVIPLARGYFACGRHLIVDARVLRRSWASPSRRSKGDQPQRQPCSAEAISGEGEAARRRELPELLARDDVDYVSIRSLPPVAPHNPGPSGDAVDHIAERLFSPLYRRASTVPTPGSSSTWTPEVQRILVDHRGVSPAFWTLLSSGSEAGIVLQAYLPAHCRR